MLLDFQTFSHFSPLCDAQNTTWEHGEVHKHHVIDTATWFRTIEEALLGQWGGRLYLTDGVLPYENSDNKGAPGLCCAVNDAANGMLPDFLRSDRANSLLNFMKVSQVLHLLLW